MKSEIIFIDSVDSTLEKPGCKEKEEMGVRNGGWEMLPNSTGYSIYRGT